MKVCRIGIRAGSDRAGSGRATYRTCPAAGPAFGRPLHNTRQPMMTPPATESAVPATTSPVTRSTSLKKR